MRRNIGEFDESIKKLYGSLRKKFGLSYEKSLDYVDRIFEKNNYPVIFVSSDDSLSREFISEVNDSGLGEAIGFFKDDSYVYDVDELREMVPKLLNQVNKFVYISIEARSRFRLEIDSTIFVKMGKLADQLWIDVEINEIAESEIIRKLASDDFKEFNILLNKLYLNRWECRKDIFEENYKFSSSEMSIFCERFSPNGGFVCIRDDKIVGFILYEHSNAKESRAYTSKSELVVKDMYVVEEYRRLGIASRLFNQVKKLASKYKCTSITFKLWSDDELTKKFISSLHYHSLYSICEIEV